MGQWGIKAADNIARKSAPREGPSPRSSVLLKFACCVIKCVTRLEYKLVNCFFNQLYPVQLSSALLSLLYYIYIYIYSSILAFKHLIFVIKSTVVFTSAQ